MITNDLADVILQKCEIYYEDALISKEKIIEQYIMFFSDALANRERSVSFALHTGSVCFDVVSIVAVVLGCLSYNIATNDDVIENLQVGDMVMYKNQRYWWCGIQQIEQEQRMVLEQDAKGKNGRLSLSIPKSYKHLIKPYYGTSKTTDGRGIRRKKTNREEFLSYIFNIPIENVPSVVDIAIVILANRNSFYKICKNIKIVYGNKKKIGILDIVPAAYYTSSGEECQYGENPTKAEAVIKVAGNITVARELVLDKQGNKVIGLLVADINFRKNNDSELGDILRRKALRFVYITVPIQMNIREQIWDMHDDARMFACTKEFLSKYINEINERNKFTLELKHQISNIVNNTISIIHVSGGWSWEEYKQIKNDLLFIRKSSWSDSYKNSFILAAYGLLNLFTTSFFSMSQLENAIAEEHVNVAVMSPEKRILEIRNLAHNAGTLEERCLSVVDAIERKYNEMKYVSPKGQVLRSYIESHTGKRIAVIVSKAYYTSIFRDFVQKDFIRNNITCVTAKRFDVSAEYDALLVIGDIYEKEFDSLQCRATKNVDVMLYNCEETFFRHRQKKQSIYELKINAMTCGIEYEELSDAIVDEIDFNNSDEDFIQTYSDLEQYIENISAFDIHNFATSYSVANSNIQISEIKYVGKFVTGEYIFFSKYYKAVVFDEEAGKVIETSIDKLTPGDFLVFAKRDNYTQNIVDFIFKELLTNGKLERNIVEASEKALYWKKALLMYKEDNGYRYKDIAMQLRKAGCSLQESTIREWLIEGSHIVGPRNIKTMEYVAMVTRDSYLLDNVDQCFEACRIVRHERRSILELITRAINDKLSGYIPPKGSLLEIVYDNVDNLSETLELDNISELDESINININLVNRPITESEVSI